MKLMTSLAIAALTTAPPLCAQWTQEPASASGPTRTATIQAEMRAFRADSPESRGRWSVVWSAASRTPKAIWGPGLRVSQKPVTTSGQAAGLAADLLENHEKMLGRGASAFELATVAKVNRTWVLVYDQMFDGLRIVDGRADVRLNENGVCALFGAEAFPIGRDFDTAPGIARERARALASAGPSDEVELVIWVRRDVVDCKPALAWAVHVSRSADHGITYINAKSGELIEVRSGRYSCCGAHTPARSGSRSVDLRQLRTVRAEAARSAPASAAMTVSGSVMAWRRGGFGPGGTLVNVPVSGAHVQVAGGSSAFTDENGDFSIPHAGASPVQVSVNFSSGQLLGAVTPSQGTPISASAMITPGTPGVIQIASASATEFEVAQTTAFTLTDEVARYVRRPHILGADPAIDTLNSLSIAVNDTQFTCNASYQPGQLTFAAAGQAQGMTCPNFAFSTVVEHEWGHGLDDAFGGIGSGDLAEGWADVIANFCTGQPLIGENFNGPGQHVRDANNTAQYPSGQAHQGGLVWMGGCWKLRQALIGSMGAVAGTAHAETIVLGSLPANASTIPDAVREVYIADDDDGNLNNGTPNCSALLTAFTTTHNIPSPVQTCSANPGLVTSFGAGCAGSGLLPAVCESLNENGTASGLFPSAPPGFRLAYAVTAAQARSIDTIELFTQGAGGQIAVHRSAGGVPVAMPAATATLNAGAGPAWYVANLATPISIAAGETVFLVHDAASFGTALLNSGAAPSVPTVVDPGIGQWLPLAALQVPDAPAWRVSCVGGGQAGAVPTLSSNDLVEIGRSFTLDIDRVVPNASVALSFGISNTVLPGGAALPIDLSPIGATSCWLLTSSFAVANLTADPAGRASLTLPVGNDPTSVGTVFYTQGFVIDPLANALGVVTTNGLSLLVGTP